MKIISQPCFKS